MNLGKEVFSSDMLRICARFKKKNHVQIDRYKTFLNHYKTGIDFIRITSYLFMLKYP